MKDKVKVIELFAGVGGFRVGLEGYPKKKDSDFEIVWSNQWEPNETAQWANRVYRYHFSKHKTPHSEIDIAEVNPKDIPSHDMLVGGFPCQDFSVGSLNKFSGGLEGSKGVLWYQIRRILHANILRKQPTKYLVLENVDRLLKCPVNLKGGDFYKILMNLNRMGYAAEWKVINAGDYNMPQRRRRIFIVGYHSSTPEYKKIQESVKNYSYGWIKSDGVLASAFPSNYEDSNRPFSKIPEYYSIFKDRDQRDDSKLTEFENNVQRAQDKKKLSPFKNSGLLIKNNIYTLKHTPVFIENKNPMKKFLEKDKSKILDEFIVSSDVFDAKWKPAKGAKKQTRKSADGLFTYNWSEGGMSEHDSIDKPARTIITSEGGSAASRTKHIIKYGKQYRRLLPSELDQLNMFKKDFTKYGLDDDGVKVEISASRRAFLMGNALVVGVIDKIGRELAKRIKK